MDDEATLIVLLLAALLALGTIVNACTQADVPERGVVTDAAGL